MSVVQSPTPLVSVITPTYNRPEYLKLALESAVAQSYSNIEIIVSDNCSPQNIQALVESFNDSRIRYSRNAKNLGMIANTLKAFKMAQGKYVACLLDDDLWESDFLAKLVPPLEANANLALAFCDHYVIKGDGSIDHETTQRYSQVYNRVNLKEGTYQPFSKLALVDGAVSTATSAVMRRDAIAWDTIPLEVEGSWDVYLNYLFSRSGKAAYYKAERLTSYREHELTDTMQSGSRNYQSKIRKAKGDIFCYEQFMADERLVELKPYFKQRWAHLNTTLGVGLMRAAQLKEARSCFWRSLQEKFSLRTVAALFLSFTPSTIAAKF